ncbi:MAG: recombinase zinc beta ribbon domain-containing protein [Proteobacteria bacterium]|nr:recombinase zinc beta ribbon domain-containing protein [Pseudomonadota bacterium]
MDAWPLQNRLRCSICGSRFKCTYGRNGRRSYRCFGRETNSPYFQRTRQRCTASILEAQETDADLLNAIYIALSQPENFRAALEVSINALKAKLADLERDVAPVRKELDAVSAELGRIELAWVRGVLPSSNLDLLERSAKAEESEFAGVTALFVGLFEPAMILVMGGVVMLIVLAILLPIFDMNDLLQ